MSYRRFAAVASKEMIQIIRDTRSLIIVILMPIILVLLFGYGVNLDVKHVPVYVFDREGSQQSQDLLKRFQASEYFRLIRAVDSYPKLVRAIDDGHAKLGLVIPPDFSERLRSGQPVSVQAIVDATDDNTANVAVNYSQAVVNGFSQDVQIEWLRDRGATFTGLPLNVEARTWYN